MLHFVLLIVLVILFAFGQVLFKKAALSIGDSEFLTGLISVWMALALVLYGLATVLWVWILKTIPLTVAYAFSSLAFIVVPLAAHVMFGEELSVRYAVGASLIVTGVVITST